MVEHQSNPKVWPCVVVALFLLCPSIATNLLEDVSQASSRHLSNNNDDWHEEEGVSRPSSTVSQSSPYTALSGPFRHPFLSVQSTASDRIFNGRNASVSDYGYFVGILVRNEEGRQGTVCGGSLLSPRFVITAAHCIRDAEESDGGVSPLIWGVRVGFFCRFEGNCGKTMQDIAAKQFYIHPKYDQDLFKFDLAIIELMEPTYMFPTVTPDLGGVDLRLGDEVTAIGLGLDSENAVATTLQEQVQRYMPTSMCEGWLGTGKGFFERGTVCSYTDSFEGGVCRGDSGGPLLWKGDKNGKNDATPSSPVVVGVASFAGIFCSQRKLPDAFAAVRVGRDDLWGPLVCNRKLDDVDRPSWCKGRLARSRSLPDPTPQNEFSPPTPDEEDPVDGIRVDRDRYRYFTSVLLFVHARRLEILGCRGVLIHPSFVLTPANCVESPQFELREVIVGHQCDVGCRTHLEFRNARQHFVHPNFNSSLPAAWNFGLIQLDEPISQDFVPNIPILDDGSAYEKLHEDDAAETIVRAVGFHKLPKGASEAGPMDLQQVTTRRVREEICTSFTTSIMNAQYDSVFSPDDNVNLDSEGLFICSERLGLGGHCTSLIRYLGAPLIVPNGDQDGGRDILVGIAVFRPSECKNEVDPDVYGRVSAAHEWIRCVICIGVAPATSDESATMDEDLCPASFLADNRCESLYGIVLGSFSTVPPTENVDKPRCIVEKETELKKSKFIWDPTSGKTRKCKKIGDRGLKSFFCAKVQRGRTDARDQCPHACGLC